MLKYIFLNVSAHRISEFQLFNHTFLIDQLMEAICFHCFRACHAFDIVLPLKIKVFAYFGVLFINSSNINIGFGIEYSITDATIISSSLKETFVSYLYHYFFNKCIYFIFSSLKGIRLFEKRSFFLIILFNSHVFVLRLPKLKHMSLTTNN